MWAEMANINNIGFMALTRLIGYSESLWSSP